MRLELTGRHLAITPPIRRLVEQRLSHTLRVLKDSAVSAHVVVTAEGGRIRAEVTLHAGRERFLHGEAAGSDLRGAVTAAAGKVDRQAKRLKGKWRESKRRGPSATKAAAAAAARRAAAADAAAGAPRKPERRRRIVRGKRYALKPLTVQDAAATVPDRPESILVFRNLMTGAVNVLFRRRDGNLCLVEPDV